MADSSVQRGIQSQVAQVDHVWARAKTADVHLCDGLLPIGIGIDLEFGRA